MEPKGEPRASLRDRIKAKADIESEIIDVPEWDVKLEIKTMTGAERAAMLQRAIDQDSGEVDYGSMNPEVVVACSFDPETGEKVFSDGDLEWLQTKSAKALERVGLVGMRLSGMGKDSEKALGKGSSTSGPSASPTSA